MNVQDEPSQATGNGKKQPDPLLVFLKTLFVNATRPLTTVEEVCKLVQESDLKIRSKDVYDAVKRRLNILDDLGLIEKVNVVAFRSIAPVAVSTPQPAPAIVTPHDLMTPPEGPPVYVPPLFPELTKKEEDLIRETVYALMQELVIDRRSFVMEKVIQARTQDKLDMKITINVIGFFMYEFAQLKGLVKWKLDTKLVGQGAAYALKMTTPPGTAWYMAS